MRSDAISVWAVSKRLQINLCYNVTPQHIIFIYNTDVISLGLRSCHRCHKYRVLYIYGYIRVCDHYIPKTPTNFVHGLMARAIWRRLYLYAWPVSKSCWPLSRTRKFSYIIVHIYIIMYICIRIISIYTILRIYSTDYKRIKSCGAICAVFRCMLLVWLCQPFLWLVYAQ